MLLSLAYLVIRMLLRLLVPNGQGEAAKDLEIVVLRHELNVLRRQIKRPLFRPCDRPILAAAARRLPRAHWDRFLVTPKTLLRWHRELVRLKWARYSNRPPGRPPLPIDMRELILRLAKENPRWGYKRIQGELQKLGIKVSATAIRKLLVRRGLGPAPRRGGTTWRQFLAQQASSMMAGDFSPSKPCGSNESTCWCSSSSRQGASISPVARPIPRELGSCSRRGISLPPR
jgi:putative transposase